MRVFLFLFLSLVTVKAVSAHDYSHASDWLTPPEGMDQIGNSHGEIDVDSQGLVYVSVAG